MILLSPREAGRFRAALRRCLPGRARNLAPPVFLRPAKEALTLAAFLDEVGIALRIATTATAPARLVIPYALLSNLEGIRSDSVSLEEIEPGRVRCQWTEAGTVKTMDGGALAAESAAAPWPLPKLWHPIDVSLFGALHACGKMAGHGQARAELARLQLRGAAGEIAGTDGRQLLLCRGLTLPFADNVLVPAVPLFGSPELAGAAEARLGRTARHLVLTAGPWTVWLALDTVSRYPDVTTVLVHGSSVTRLQIHEADATALQQVLAQRPSTNGELCPITVDLATAPTVQLSPTGTRRGKVVRLAHSQVSGPGLSVTLDRKYLVQALAMGLREAAAATPSRILFHDAARSYVVAAMEGQAASTDEPVPAAAAENHEPVDFNPSNPGGPVMNPATHGGPSPASDSEEAVRDPLTEAEALRAALLEVGRRISRLILALRQMQKQRRVLQSAWASLQHLGLGSKEAP